MTFRELFGHHSGSIAILIGIGLGALWSWEQGRKLRSRVVPVDPDHPVWLAALDKARASLPQFRELAAAHPTSAFIKYALQTSKGTTEHVWGALVSIGEGTITVNLDTPPVDGKPARAPPYVLQMSEIEDWRVDASDGRIYGAYTSRAHIEYFRTHGHEIPPQWLEMEKFFVDP